MPSLGDCAVPTTSPRLLTLVASLSVLPRLPRSVAEPSLSQSTACGPAGFTGGRVVFEHKPDVPTTWPLSLIPKANPTVSPLRGLEFPDLSLWPPDHRFKTENLKRRYAG